MSTATKRQRCKECGKRKEDVIDGCCERCEEDTVYCEVCQERYPRESERCRHLFWCEYGDSGAGAYESKWDYCRESFFELLDLFAMIPANDCYPIYGWLGWRWDEPHGRDLIAEIEKWLLKDNFWTFLHGSMLGPPDCDFKHCRRASDDWCVSFAELRSSWIDVWSAWCPKKYEAAGDGFNWLSSLEAEKTKQANAVTLKWVFEWRATRALRQEQEQRAMWLRRLTEFGKVTDIIKMLGAKSGKKEDIAEVPLPRILEVLHKVETRP